MPNRLAALIIVGFLILGGTYAAYTPLFEPPDEAAHFIYADTIARTGRLPLINADRDEAFRTLNVEAHQPPLHYLLTAAVIAPFNRDDLPAHTRLNPFAAVGAATGANANVHLHPPTATDGHTRLAMSAARALSLLMGAVTLWAVYRAGTWAGGERVGLGALLLAASIPTFVHISASVNNDNVTNMVYALGVMLALRVWQRRTLTRADAAALSLTLAAAALSKTTALTLFGVIAGALLLGAVTGRFRWRAVLLTEAAIIVTVALLAGWWYVRNAMLYGDPLAFAATSRIWSRGVPTWPPPGELWGVWVSFWMTLGHFNVPGPPWLTAYASIITVMGLSGAVITAVRRPNMRWRVLFLVGVCALVTAALLVATRRVNVSQGRLLFPALAAFAPLLLLGWRALLGRWGMLLPILPLTVVALAAPWTALRPAYPPLAPVDALPPLQAINAQAESLTLYGYRVGVGGVSAGDDLPIDLFFSGHHPENPALFITVQDSLTGDTLASVDTYPGMAPTDALRPQVIYRARVTVPALDAPANPRPQQLTLAVGWRVPDADDPGAGRFLPWTGDDGTPLGGVFAPGPTLTTPGYTPEAPAIPLTVRFGEVIRLDGATITPDGDALAVGLNWSRLAPINGDFTLTVGLVDTDGELVAQQDGPVPGYPTSAWVDAPFRTDYRLSIPAGTELAALRVGWYDAGSGVRLPAAGDVPIRDNLLFIPLSGDTRP